MDPSLTLPPLRLGQPRERVQLPPIREILDGYLERALPHSLTPRPQITQRRLSLTRPLGQLPTLFSPTKICNLSMPSMPARFRKVLLVPCPIEHTTAMICVSPPPRSHAFVVFDPDALLAARAGRFQTSDGCRVYPYLCVYTSPLGQPTQQA